MLTMREKVKDISYFSRLFDIASSLKGKRNLRHVWPASYLFLLLVSKPSLTLCWHGLRLLDAAVYSRSFIYTARWRHGKILSLIIWIENWKLSITYLMIGAC